MNQQHFDTQFEQLTPRQKEMLKPFLLGQADRQIAQTWHCTEDNVRRHIANICKVFLLSDSMHDHCRPDLVELFVQYRPEWVGSELRDRYAPAPPTKLHRPDRPLALDSPFYIPPLGLDRGLEEVQEPGALIRIRAPHKRGKTSLLNRILAQAQHQGYHTVMVNLRGDTDASQLTDLSQFLPWFCTTLAQKLALDPGTLPTTKRDGTHYLQTYLLPQLQQPLVLAIDEADWLFEYPATAKDFFALLRVWHEYAKNPGMEIWEHLRLAIAHATDDYIKLDSSQSPFRNVGYVMRLPPLSPAQVQHLAQRYRLRDVSPTHLEQLIALVGGHPYLIQQAFYAIAQGDQSWPTLLAQAPTLEGIYRGHLQNLLEKLHQRTDQEAGAAIAEGLRQVIATQGSVRLSQEQTFKLEGLGIVHLQGNQVQLSCELYRQFFQDWLFDR